MKGYKVFDQNWTCIGTEYRVGETATMNDLPELGRKGFHFCERAIDCLIYRGIGSSKFAEVEAIGVVVSDGHRCATNSLRVIREISEAEMRDMCTGKSYTYYNIPGPKPAIESVTEWARGVQHGSIWTWWPTGEKHSLEHFENGRLHGVSMIWEVNGSLSYMVSHRNGVIDGYQYSTTHTPNGPIYKTLYHENGTKIEL